MRFLNHLRIAAVGFLMGAADLIPGVSGGTIAFVCGIYDRFITGLRSLDLPLLRAALARRWSEVWSGAPWVFFAMLGTGLLSAIFTLSKVLNGLFASHPVELWSAFFGLIAGSILLLARETRPWGVGGWATFLLATSGTYLLVGLPAMHLPPGPLSLFFAGAIAICAMILPGISGSYLLVILGQYGVVLEAVAHRDFVSLTVFAAGVATGVLSFARVVSWLLKRYRRATLVALTGVMAGALRTVWPWKVTLAWRLNSRGQEVPLEQINIAPPDGTNLLVPIACALAGAALVLALHRLAPPEEKKNGTKTP